MILVINLTKSKKRPAKNRKWSLLETGETGNTANLHKFIYI